MNTNGVTIIKLDTGARTPDQIRTLISQVDALIASLNDTAIKSINSGHIAEYEIDNGQSRQRVKYTSMEQVLKAIDGYENLRTRYENKLIPRIVSLLPNENLKNRY